MIARPNHRDRCAWPVSAGALMRHVLLVAVFSLLLLPSKPAGAAPVSPPRVLILDETVYGGAGSQEALAAQLALPGCIIDVVDAANWMLIPGTGTGGPTGYGFDSYRALILGDPICTGMNPTNGTSSPNYLAALNALNATKTIWSPAVSGNVILEGVDNAFHSSSQVGADKTLKRGIAFAVNDPGKTGLYYALSCYYDYTAPANTPTVVPHLSGFGTFKVRNYPGACFNDAHIVATHPVFTSAPALTDAELSNWSCSTHEGFDVWPPNFVVLAIALTNGTYTATDGSNGVPYILVRGEGVEVVTTISLGPPVATNELGTTHTVCATISTNVMPRVSVPVTFTITSGPNAVTNFTTLTDTNGTACFTYLGAGGPGIDYITASYMTPKDVVVTSPTVSKIWVGSCLGVGAESLNCSAEGMWSYSFSVTNLAGYPISSVSLLNPPAGVTITPATFVFSPALNSGQSATVTVNVSGLAPGSSFCFELGSRPLEGTVGEPCHFAHCLTVPACCTRVLTNKLVYIGSAGGLSIYNYSITIQNVTADPLRYVVFAPDQPCVSFVQPLIDLALPAYGGPGLLLPAQTRTLTGLQVQMRAPCPGPHGFLMSTLNTNLVACCSTRWQLPKPTCIKIISPYDSSVVLTNTRVTFTAVAIGPCPFTRVRFYQDTTLLGVVDSADGKTFSLAATLDWPGTFSFTAVAELSDGDLDTSDPVTVTVIVPGYDEDQHTAFSLSAGVTENTMLLNIPTALGQQYEVQYRTNLTEGDWLSLENFMGHGKVRVVPDAVTNRGSRFYRGVLRH